MKLCVFPRLLMVALCGMTGAARAQEAGREADKAALRALGQRYEEAINLGNLTSMSDVILPDASAVFATGDEVRGLAAMQGFMDKMKGQLGAGSRYSVKLRPDDTDFFGESAIAHGSSDESVTLGTGRSLSYTTRWTAVLRKVDGHWLVSRLHVSLDPIDNPIVSARLRLRTWMAGGAGLLLGAVGGWAVARRARG